MLPNAWDDLETDAYDISAGCPSIPKMKERFQATITHLRDNISRAIESDVRDFGGSSHLLMMVFDCCEGSNRSCLAQH